MVIFSSDMGSKWRSAFSDIACSVARSQARNLGSQVFPSRPGKSASLWFGFLTKPKQRKVRVNFVLWRKVKAIAFHYLGVHSMQNVLSMITYCQKNSHFLSCLDRIDLMCFFLLFWGLEMLYKKIGGKGHVQWILPYRSLKPLWLNALADLRLIQPCSDPFYTERVNLSWPSGKENKQVHAKRRTG